MTDRERLEEISKKPWAWLACKYQSDIGWLVETLKKYMDKCDQLGNDVDFATGGGYR